MTSSIDFKEYEQVATNCGSLVGVEVDLMLEILKEWQAAPGKEYTLLELRDGKALAAFAIIHKVAGRNFTFDIRFLVLDRDYRSTPVMSHLFELIDQEILKN